MRLATASEHGGQTATKRTQASDREAAHNVNGEQTTANRATVHNAPTAPVRRTARHLRVALVALCTLLGAWTGNKAYAAITSTSREINGKISFVIERKTLTPAQAAIAIANKDDIRLWVYLKFEGDWVTWFDSKYRAKINMSSFSYGIATKDGFNETDAKLWTGTDQPAYMLAHSKLNCSADGKSLTYFDQDFWTDGGAWIESPDWMILQCPVYEYGLSFVNASILNGLEKITEGGKTYYRLRLFQIGFRLKRAETVYVRNIDGAQYGGAQTDAPNVYLKATSGITELNLVSSANDVLYWPGGNPNSNVQDWTTAPPAFYGVENGGIFIATGPEVTQFAFDKSVFCPGEKVTYTATVKVPNDMKRSDLTYSFSQDGVVISSIKGDRTVVKSTSGITLQFDPNPGNDNDNGNIKLKGEMTWAAYVGYVQSSYNNGTGKTTYKVPTFTFSITKNNESTKVFPSKTDSTNSTPLPKIRLHVSNYQKQADANGATASGKTEAPFVRTLRTNYSNFDLVSGPTENSTVYVRGTTRVPSPNTPGATASLVVDWRDFDLVKSATLYKYESGSTPPLVGVTSPDKANDNRLRQSLLLGSNPALYVMEYIATNGCVFYSDTITIKPKKSYAAPVITIDAKIRCQETKVVGVDMPGGLEIKAKAPSNATAVDWQWVIRQESCKNFVTSSINPSTVTDPLTPPSDNMYFGGGFIMSTSGVAYEGKVYPNTKSYATDYGTDENCNLGVNYTVDYTLTAKKDGTQGSTLALNGTARNFTISNTDLREYQYLDYRSGGTLISAWMPKPDGFLQKESQSNCADDVHAKWECDNTDAWVSSVSPYFKGTNKNIYVRYKTDDDQWSPWGYATPDDALLNNGSFCEKVENGGVGAGSQFDLTARHMLPTPPPHEYTHKNSHTWGPKFAGKKGTGDTTVERGNAVELKVTTDLSTGGDKNEGRIFLSADLFWLVSTDDGATWTTWHVTPVGTEIGADDNHIFLADKIGFIEAPLRYPTQKELHKVIYMPTCPTTPSCDTSSLVTIGVFSTVAPGEIVADLGGGVYKDIEYKTLCADTVDLVLQGYQPGATLKWYYREPSESTWTLWSGKTSDKVTYKDFKALTNQSQYTNGTGMQFKVWVVAGTDSAETNPFTVTKHYVMTPTLKPVTARLTTSGVCVGTKADLSATTAQSYVDGTYVLEQSTDGVTFGGSWGTTNGKNFSKAAVALSDNGLYLRVKNTNNGCVAYSKDTVIKVVNKPAAGTISPSEICPNRDETLTYSGPGDEFAWSWFKTGEVEVAISGTGRSVTINIPANEFWGSSIGVPVSVTPSVKITEGSDVTTCAGDAVDKVLTKADNCSVKLDPTTTAFCANALQDVALTLTPNFPTSGNTFTFQYSTNSGSSWADMTENTHYTLTTNSGNVTGATIKSAFFTGKSGAIQIRVKISTLTDPSAAVTVTVNPLPTFANLTATAGEQCAGEDLQLKTTASASVTGGSISSTVYAWQVAADASANTAGTYNNVGASDASGAATYANFGTNTMTMKTLGTITKANRDVLNGRFFKVKVTATTNNGCTDTKYTPAVQLKLNPLPDTAKFVKKVEAGTISSTGNGKTVATTACKGTPVTLKATLDGTLTTAGVPNQGNYTYLWKEGTSTLSNGTNGYAITNDGASNTAAQCVVPGTFSASLADNTLKTFTLEVGAQAKKADGTAAGCIRSVKATYNITYKVCAAEVLKIGGANKTKGSYEAVCENDATWKDVSVAPASLFKADNLAATITKQTIYHCVKTDAGTYRSFVEAISSANATAPVLTGAAIKGNSTYNTPGSHYYFAVVERAGSGYDPRVSDTIEYVVGAVPVNDFSSAAVKAKSSNGGTVVTDFTTDLKVCAGLQVDLAVSGITDPTDANAAILAAGGRAKGGIGLSNGFKWYKDNTAAMPSTEPAMGNTGGAGSTDAINSASTSYTGYYHVWRTYERNTLIKTTGNTYKTCEKTFPIGTAQVTVVPMPTKPTVTLAATPATVCAGEESTISLSSSIADNTPSGHSYKFRWFKGSTPDPVYNGKQPFETGSNALAAAGTKKTSPTANETWTLKVYLNNTLSNWSCYDTATGSATVTVKALPTLADITLSPATVIVCGPDIVVEGTSQRTVTLNAPAAATGATYTYKWYKRNSGETTNNISKATLVSDAANRYSGSGTKSLTITGNLTSGQETAGDYFVEITAKNTADGSCPITKISTNAVKVNVYPAPTFGGKLDFTAGGTSGIQTTICTGGTPALTWAPKSGVSDPVYTHKLITNQGDGALSPVSNPNTFTLAAAKTATAANKTYDWTLRATSNGCIKDSAITFKVTVVDCSKDAVLNGRNGDGHSATKPFQICSNEPASAWPTVKISAQSWAGQTIKSMKLYHSTTAYNATDFAEVPAGAWITTDITGSTDAGYMVFDPTHASADAKYRTPGSHYYYAIVNRATAGDVKTDVVEYMVGALAPRSVVSGGHIATLSSTTAPSSYVVGDSLKQFCLGEAANAYMYIVGLGNLPANVSLLSSQWYESTTHDAVSDLPKASGWTKKGTDNTTSGAIAVAVGSDGKRSSKFYYQYRKYRYSNAFAYATATAAKTCDTTYPIGSVGVLIVNPKPKMPTAVGKDDKTVCDGTSITLNGALTPASAASGSGTGYTYADEWSYRWLRQRQCGSAGGVMMPFNKNIYPAANADWATKYGQGLAQAAYAQTVTEDWNGGGCAAAQALYDRYHLVVYGKATYTDTKYGNKVCYDSTLALMSSTIIVNPEITLSTTVASNPTNGEICFDKNGNTSVSITVTPTTTATDKDYKWYKLRGATPDTTQDMLVQPNNMKLYTNPSVNVLTIKGAHDSVDGQYYARVKVGTGSCENKAYTTPKTIKVNPLPNPDEFVTAQTINDEAKTSHVACAGNEDIKLKVTTLTNSDATVQSFAYNWTAKPRGSGAAGTDTWTIAKANATKTTNTTDETYTIEITGTTAAGCSAKATKNFTVKILDCSPDGIADNSVSSTTKIPSAYSSTAKSVAICKSDADATGRPLNIVPNTGDGRGNITKIEWYYAPVKADLATGNKLDVDWSAAKMAKSCTGNPITHTSAACIYNPAKETVAGESSPLNTHKEWMIWIKVTRATGAPYCTDTISYVVRENPTISNLDQLKLGWGSNVPLPDKLVCQNPPITAVLSLNDVPKFDAPSAGGKRGEVAHAATQDKIKYEWTYEVNNSSNNSTVNAAAAVPTYSTGVPKTTPTSPVITTSKAPTGTKYQDNYKLTAEFSRDYSRVADSRQLPSYSLTCWAVESGTTKKVMTLRDTVFSSIAPNGTLKDGDSKTNKQLCTSAIGASDKITLTFKEDAATPAATVTKWEWDQGNGTWADWAAVGSNVKVIEVALNDSRLTMTKPAEGADKTYKFRAKTVNGACSGESPEYVLTIEGAVSAGTIAFDPDKLCAGTDATLKATGVKPLTAKIDFAVYASNPGSTESTSVTEKKGAANQTAAGGAVSVTINGIGTTADVNSGAVTYYGRYIVKAKSTCPNAVSTVATVTYYPTPTFDFVKVDPEKICLTGTGQEVEISFSSTYADDIKIYAFNSGGSKTAAQVAGGTLVKTLSTAEITAQKFKVEESKLFADNPTTSENSKTHFYALASQTNGVSGCKDVGVKTTSVQTALPVEKPVIAWDAAGTITDAGSISRGTGKTIYVASGGKNANAGLSKYHWAPAQTADATKPDETKKADIGAYAAGTPPQMAWTPNAQGVLYAWLFMKGYSSCPDVKSDPIKIEVIASAQYSIKGGDVCRVNTTTPANATIVLEIDMTSGQGGINTAAGTYKWQYRKKGVTAWTDVPVGSGDGEADVKGDADNYKLTWPHKLPAGEYEFIMKYEKGSSDHTPTETNVLTIKIHAEPTLSSLDALNLPASTCVGTAFAVKNTATIVGSIDLQLSADPTAATPTWATEVNKAANNVSKDVSAKDKAGFYRLKVYTHDKCEVIYSNYAKMTVDDQTVAGTLTITPTAVCFGKEVTITLTGHTGDIVDYEYHPKRSSDVEAGDKPASPADGDKVWRSVVGSTSTTYPFPSHTLAAQADGFYPSTWKVNESKNGYYLRAKVKNGACPAQYAKGLGDIYDTVIIATNGHPKNVQAIVETGSGLPKDQVKFKTTTAWAGAKYADKNVPGMSNQAAKTYQWQYSVSGVNGPWLDLADVSGKLSGATAEELVIESTWWASVNIDKAKLSNTYFRMKVKGSSCNDEKTSNPAKIEPQTDLKAGEITPQADNPGKCFFYGDTVILFHDGASGQGRVSHHWRWADNTVTEDESTLDKDKIQTLALKGIKAWHPTIDGVVDSSKLYMLAPAGQDAKTWWSQNYTYVVIVTDSKNPAADKFNATTGAATANVVSGHFVVKKLCFAEKPVWKMPHDTVCTGKQDTTFEVNLSALGNNTALPTALAVNVDLLEFAFKAKSEAAYTKVVAFSAAGNTLTGTYAVGSAEVTAELKLGTDNKPNGKLKINAKTPALNKIDEAFDSLSVQAVIHTDHSQKNDTVFAVLRIDKGIKEITATTDLVVCQGKPINFAGQIVRHQESLLRPIEWVWQRAGSDGNKADVTDGRPSPAKTTAGDKAVKPSVASNIAEALPTDSGVWTLKATTQCGVAAIKDYNVKVNVLPTWIDDLSETATKQCQGSMIELNAKLSVNWNPSIEWQHSLTGADDSWTTVVPQTGRVDITVDSTSTYHQTSIGLRISPTYLSDSGYYRIEVTTPAGLPCAGTKVHSKKAHISLDTVPMFKVDATSKKNVVGRTGLRTDESTSLTVTVLNSPTASFSDPCSYGTGSRLQTGTWYVMKPNADATGYETAQPWDDVKSNYGNVSVPIPNTADNGKTYKMDINNARGDLNNLKFFMKVENCCGESNTDTVIVTVTDNLAILEQTNDTVCEGTTAELTVTANLNIDATNKRQWQYSKDGTSWTAVPLNNPNDPLFAGATEKMENNVAVLTIPNAKYAINGYKFRLGLTESSTIWSNVSLGEVMTLIVKPVTNLRVFVTADPNPAPQDTKTNKFNWTRFEAKLAIVTPGPAGDTTFLTEEEIKLFGYTEFDWYQIRKDMITRKANVDSFTDAGENPNDSVFLLEKLKYDVHDSTLYFAVLKNACVERYSDTTLLRMYSDLHVEWKINVWEQWVTDLQEQPNPAFSPDEPWLPAGTTVEDLSNYPDLPTNTIIPLEPGERDMVGADGGDHQHRMSFAYYIFCDDGEDEIEMNLELIKGVLSQNINDIVETREWEYSFDRGESWYLVDKFGENGVTSPESPVAPSKARFDAKSQREKEHIVAVSDLNGAWFRFIAHAQIKLDENEQPIVRYYDDEREKNIYEYVYNDTSRVLEIVFSELVTGKELHYASDRVDNEATCAPHNYVFAPTPTSESFHYEWSMMRPGDTGFVKIDSLQDKEIFHYGFVQDAALENGTKVRVKIGSFCGDTVIEAEIHVMTVKLDDVQTDICADGELELKATAKDYGEKEPTYKWFINGVEVPGQTSTTLKFSQGIIPAGAVNAEGKYEVQIVAYADASVPFINQTACDEVTIMLRPMPTGINASADPTSTTVEAGTTLSATVGEGSTVAWTPADKVENPAEATTPAKGLTPGENIFYATVTTEYGCTATDSVIVMVASTFALDSMTPIAIMPPSLPFDDHRDENGNINPNDTIPQTGEYGAQRGGMVTADSMVIWACENSVGFVSVHTSGGTPVLVYEWLNPDGTPVDTLPGDGEQPAFHRLTAEEIHAYGYDSLVNDSTFAFFLDGKVRAFRCKVTDKDGRGSTLVMKVGVMYYVTQHVAIEAIPHMRHNRFYEDQPIFLSGHPTRFSWYSFYDYNVNRDEVTKEQLSEKSLYQTSYIQEEGEDRIVYVSVFDEHKCRSYDSVVIKVIPLPNAMILNDPDYPEADLLFPEFEVEIHDSWGRLVKAMDEGRGWDAKRGGKQVQGGTYYYRVKLPTTDGFTYIKGAVTVFTKKK